MKAHLIQFFIFKALFTLFNLLSFKKASSLGGWLIQKIGPFTKFNAVASSNLNIAFPNLDANKKQSIITGMWDNLGRTIGELCHLLKCNTALIEKHITFHDKHNLEYLADGGFVFSAHFANWEIAQSVFANSQKKIYIVYQALNNPYLDQLVKKYRSALGAEMIAKGKAGAKKIIEAIKEKSIIIMLSDQRQTDGIIIPFFNQPCYTTTAIANLAIKYNLPIIPIHATRNKEKFDIWIEKPLDLQLTSNKALDIESAMMQINKIIETWVIKNPEQWFWIHRRWSLENTHKK